MNYIKPYPNSYTVYSKHGCHYCIKAKVLLSNLNPKSYVIECDDYLQDNKEDFLKFINDYTGREYRTFPMIFHNGKFIGGYTEAQQYHDKLNAFTEFEDVDF